MSVTRTFTVTVSNPGSGNKYFIDGVQQDTINLAEGGTYVFNYPSAHPFKFSTTSDGTHNSGSEYTTGVTMGPTKRSNNYINWIKCNLFCGRSYIRS